MGKKKKLKAQTFVHRDNGCAAGVTLDKITVFLMYIMCKDSGRIICLLIYTLALWCAPVSPTQSDECLWGKKKKKETVKSIRPWVELKISSGFLNQWKKNIKVKKK